MFPVSHSHPLVVPGRVVFMLGSDGDSALSDYNQEGPPTQSFGSVGRSHSRGDRKSRTYCIYLTAISPVVKKSSLRRRPPDSPYVFALYMTYNSPVWFDPRTAHAFEYPARRPLGLGPGNGVGHAGHDNRHGNGRAHLARLWPGSLARHQAAFTIVGAALGLAGGLWHLIRLAGEMSGKSSKASRRQ